jgi:hypothetical protein
MVVSTKIVALRSDIGATYWSFFNLCVLPLLLIAFVAADAWLYRKEVVQKYRLLYLLGACLAGIVLYIPSLYLVSFGYFAFVWTGAHI